MLGDLIPNTYVSINTLHKTLHKVWNYTLFSRFHQNDHNAKFSHCIILVLNSVRKGDICILSRNTRLIIFMCFDRVPVGHLVFDRYVYITQLFNIFVKTPFTSNVRRGNWRTPQPTRRLDHCKSFSVTAVLSPLCSWAFTLLFKPSLTKHSQTTSRQYITYVLGCSEDLSRMTGVKGVRSVQPALPQIFKDQSTGAHWLHAMDLLLLRSNQDLDVLPPWW